jgi:hypothetical protein
LGSRRGERGSEEEEGDNRPSTRLSFGDQALGQTKETATGSKYLTSQNSEGKFLTII